MTTNNQLRCNVKLVETKYPDNDFAIYRQTKTWEGFDKNDDAIKLTSNATYIRNIKLISDGDAATNSREKYKFYNIYLTVKNAEDNAVTHIVEGNYYLNTYEKAKAYKCVGDDLYEGTNEKILASTDATFVGIPLLPDSFVEEYISREGKITEVYLQLDENKEVMVWGWDNDYVDASGYVRTNMKGTCIVHSVIQFTPEQMVRVKDIASQAMFVGFGNGSLKAADFAKVHDKWLEQDFN